ncbi:MAG: cardiolipin synthase [Sandaracinaceae bacterium]
MDLYTILVTILPPLEMAWIVIAAVFIILQRRSAPATMAWVLALSFLPLVGILLYLFIGPRRFEKRRRRRARARGAVDRMTRVDTVVAALETSSDLSRGLVAMIENAVGRAGRPRAGSVEVFYDGRSKYEALEAAIAGAQSHVHMEYYIWEPDRIGTRVRDLLIDRAKNGVEVRVLVDGFGSSNAPSHFWEPLRAAGGRVRRFNELSFARWQPRMANFRTHRKIAVIDGLVGFTGGMNISEVHTAEFKGEAAWRDTHLELHGAIVKGLSMIFFEDWHYAGGDTPDFDQFVPEHDERPDGAVPMQVVSSGPDENLDAIHKTFFVAIAGAQHRVQLTTPYFVPDETLVDCLNAAALRGAKVQILVPEGGDQPFVAAAARSYYPELLEMGVRVYELAEPVLHSKTLVVDDLAVVGTANADNRSFRLNFEVAVAIHAPHIAQDLARAFDRDLARAKEVTLAECRAMSLPRRLISSTARLFSPIL